MSCGPRDGTGRRGSVTSTATRFAPSNPPPTELVLKPTLVMPNHAQFTVNIVVDDVPLEEFEGNRKDNVYSCWIASEEGKNFTVRWTVKPSNEAFTCSIFMDGSFVKAHVYKPVRSLVEDNIRGCTVNANTIRLFAFSRVSLTDDDAIASADQMLSDLGTIEIKIHRVEILGASTALLTQKALTRRFPIAQ